MTSPPGPLTPARPQGAVTPLARHVALLLELRSYTTDPAVLAALQHRLARRGPPAGRLLAQYPSPGAAQLDEGWT